MFSGGHNCIKWEMADTFFGCFLEKNEESIFKPDLAFSLKIPFIFLSPNIFFPMNPFEKSHLSGLSCTREFSFNFPLKPA